MKRLLLAQILAMMLAGPALGQVSGIDVVIGEHAEVVRLDETRLAPAPGKFKRGAAAVRHVMKKAEPVIGVGFLVIYVIELCYL